MHFFTDDNDTITKHDLRNALRHHALRTGGLASGQSQLTFAFHDCTTLTEALFRRTAAQLATSRAMDAGNAEAGTGLFRVTVERTDGTRSAAHTRTLREGSWVAALRNAGREPEHFTYQQTAPAPDHPAAITLDELRAALIRKGYRVLNAQEIYEDAVAHREPEWAEGDVVEDADGHFWERTGRTDLPWTGFGSAMAYAHGRPERPLVKRGTCAP
jgi:hypothetical protein